MSRASASAAPLNANAAGRSSRAARVTFWIVTVLLSLSILSGGASELLHAKGNVDGTVVKLGYPLYFLTILGAWKMAGALVILAPRLPRLKEWAYAGIFFDVTGAAASHVFAHDYGPTGFHVWVNLLFAGLVLVSWALRPKDRVVGDLPWIAA